MSEPTVESEFFLPEPSAGLLLIEEPPRRAMVVCAHPDDAEIGCGATLAKWGQAGCDISLVVCTGGQKGLPADAGSAIRAQEQECASAALGVATLVLLDREDGALEDTAEFRGDVVAHIRRLRPDVILTHDPMRSWGLLHRDHRVTGVVATDAVYPFARDGTHYPDHLRIGLRPHKVGEVLLWGGDVCNAIVNVSGFVPRQITALREHRSQVTGLTSLHEEIDAALYARAVKAARYQPFEHGEVFRRLIARG